MGTYINANPFETGSDELERYALEECAKRQRLGRVISVLILPAGDCELAVKFAHLGAAVSLCDQPSTKQSIEGRILTAGVSDEVRFVPGEVGSLPEGVPGEPFDIIVLRRGLCGLPYDQARKTVRKLLLELRIGGKIYVSVLGLHTELGDDYPGIDVSIEERYAELSPAMVKKYGIHGPLCLYSERNLFMLLLDAGASVLRTMTTTYGNVKGMAVRV
jgi:hypothetical protein